MESDYLNVMSKGSEDDLKTILHNFLHRTALNRKPLKTSYHRPVIGDLCLRCSGINILN